MNQREFAKHRGVAPPTVSEWIRRGYLKGAFKRNGRVYKIDQAKADALLKDRLHSSYRKRPDPQATGGKQREVIQSAGVEYLSFSDARAMKERYLAALRKLEYQQKSGQLVPAAGVKDIFSRMIIAMRTKFLGIQAHIGQEVSDLLNTRAEVARVTETVDRIIRQALSEFAQSYSHLKQYERASNDEQDK